ncbi:NAD(P)-binding protein [Apiospora arundinis]|uniref:NAD(P)-binding protein n=1 Tax=Apiospora arundinis TaxID=335852 RepID=A0ABR2HUK2_9PEZI
MPSYVISGASRGLGYAFAKVLAADPANTVIGLARNKQATDDRLKEDGITNVHILATDVTDEVSLRQAVSETRNILDGKGLDVLINNAAYISSMSGLKSLSDFEHDVEAIVEDANKSFDVNVIGVLRTTYAFLPLIQEGRLKKVATISSCMGDIDFVNEIGIFHGPPYSVSKAAASLLVAKFQASYRDQGILFLSLCPGAVDTDANRPDPTEENMALLGKVGAVFQKHGISMPPPVDSMKSAKQCLAAIDRSSLETGYGGSFLSFNGTKKWLEPAKE